MSNFLLKSLSISVDDHVPKERCRDLDQPAAVSRYGDFYCFNGFFVGMACAFTKGEIILEAVILTAAVVVGLTLYTFWAVRRDHDFKFLGPFLFGALIVLIVRSMIHIFFPIDKISTMIIGGVSAVVFCRYIVCDTDNIIKRYTYDQYILASVSLYLDIINVFLQLLGTPESS